MAEKRIVMEVRVLWVTDDDDETVRKTMEALDAASDEIPGPVDFVQTAFLAGAPYVDFPKLGLSEGYFEVRLEGPNTWGVAFTGPDSGD